MEERGLVTFVSPSDGLVVWIANLEKFSCHCMIRQAETLDAGGKKKQNGGVSRCREMIDKMFPLQGEEKRRRNRMRGEEANGEQEDKSEQKRADNHGDC